MLCYERYYSFPRILDVGTKTTDLADGKKDTFFKYSRDGVLKRDCVSFYLLMTTTYSQRTARRHTSHIHLLADDSRLSLPFLLLLQ